MDLADMPAFRHIMKCRALHWFSVHLHNSVCSLDKRWDGVNKAADLSLCTGPKQRAACFSESGPFQSHFFHSQSSGSAPGATWSDLSLQMFYFFRHQKAISWKWKRKSSKRSLQVRSPVLSISASSSHFVNYSCSWFLMTYAKIS